MKVKELHIKIFGGQPKQKKIIVLIKEENLKVNGISMQCKMVGEKQ